MLFISLFILLFVAALPWLPSSPLLRLLLSSDKTLLLGLLALRVVNALIIQTSYVPDEYWQSIEVAHCMAFGYDMIDKNTTTQKMLCDLLK